MKNYVITENETREVMLNGEDNAPVPPFSMSIRPAHGRLALSVELQPVEESTHPSEEGTITQESAREGAFPIELLEMIRKRRPVAPTSHEDQDVPVTPFDMMPNRAKREAVARLNPWRDTAANPYEMLDSTMRGATARDAVPNQRIVITVQSVGNQQNTREEPPVTVDAVRRQPLPEEEVFVSEATLASVRVESSEGRTVGHAVVGHPGEAPPVRPEKFRPEMFRTDMFRPEETRQEESRQEESRLEESRLEAARQEEFRQEAARQEEFRQEAARQEESRQEESRQEESRQEAARQEAARQEAARQEESRQVAARQEAARQEAARQVAAMQEAAIQEAARQEVVKPVEFSPEDTMPEMFKPKMAKSEVASQEESSPPVVVAETMTLEEAIAIDAEILAEQREGESAPVSVWIQGHDEPDEAFAARLKEAFDRELDKVDLTLVVDGDTHEGGDAMSKKRLHNKKDNDLDAQLDENWEQEASAIGEQTQEIQENLPGEELTLAQEAMADTTVMAEALMAAVPEAIHPANEFIQAPMELEATPAPKKVQSELAELLQTIKTKPISAQSRQVAAVAEAAPQGVASQPQAAAIAPKPARSGSVPTGQKLVGPRQVPVESLGSGVANLLGDAVGGVVKGSLTVASLFSSKKKVAGRGGKGVAVRSGQAGQPQRMNLVTTPTQRSVKKSGEQVGGGLHAVFNGVGQVVMGGVSIITGTAGCLTGAVVCIGQSVVNGFRPNQRKAIKMAQPPAMLANSNNGSAA